jgi:hypothetical protein
LLLERKLLLNGTIGSVVAMFISSCLLFMQDKKRGP